MPRGSEASRPYVHVELVMGTVVSFRIRDTGSSHDAAIAAVGRACAHLHDIDRRFSLYRPDSELSRLARGEVDETGLSQDVRWVLAACDDLARTSGGAFDARGHRHDGVVDPSGFVKGWAVEDAAEQLAGAGFEDWCVVAGGDIVAASPEEGVGWRVGIRHPEVASAVAAVLEIRRGAVATSGLYERGDHIVDPRSQAAPRAFRSLTVAGPSLAWADAYATAAFVMGEAGLAWVADHPGYGALAIGADDRVVWTPLIEPLRQRALSAESHAAGVS